MEDLLSFGEAANGEPVFFVEEEMVDSLLEVGARVIFERMKRDHEIPQSLDFGETMDYIKAVHDGTNADHKKYLVDSPLEEIIFGFAQFVKAPPTGSSAAG